MAFKKVNVSQSKKTAAPEDKRSAAEFHMKEMPEPNESEGAMPTSRASKQATKENDMLNGSVSKKIMMIALSAVVVLGLGTGLVSAYLTKGASQKAVVVEQTADATAVENAVRVGAVFGVPDEKTFRDDTEGVLIQGGLDGEGSHTLLRAGGESQNVYLTSSVVDLDQFVGHKVHIWGETFKGQKAGWLMDVGRVEVEKLDAETPAWYQESQEE